MIQNKRPTLLIVAVLILVSLLIAAAIYLISSRSQTGNTAIIPQTKDGQVVINLQQLNNSGESGIAILEEKAGYLNVTLNVVGGKTGVPQPAHIHVGTCPGLGTIKYSLKDVVNGVSTTVLNVNLAQLKQGLPLAINVHESNDNFKNYTACGEVVLP